jgi:hypothetical protein
MNGGRTWYLHIISNLCSARIPHSSEGLVMLSDPLLMSSSSLTPVRDSIFVWAALGTMFSMTRSAKSHSQSKSKFVDQAESGASVLDSVTDCTSSGEPFASSAGARAVSKSLLICSSSRGCS